MKRKLIIVLAIIFSTALTGCAAYLEPVPPPVVYGPVMVTPPPPEFYGPPPVFYGPPAIFAPPIFLGGFYHHCWRCR